MTKAGPESAPRALDGIRVIEISRFLPGGLAAQMLGDLGADVIKVEQPGTGEPMRAFPPMGSEDSGAFLVGNRNKRSITVNFKSPDGLRIVRGLTDSADVVIEGFRPGVADRLGLGHEALCARNPRLIYCAISGYGQTGPYRDRPGHDLNYMGASGLLQLLSHPGAGPMVPGALFADIGGGTMMAIYGILASLCARERHGAGQFVDVSMTDGAMHFLHSHASEYLMFGREPKGGEHRLAGGAAAYGVYCCADGKYLTLGVIEDHFWLRLRAIDGLESLPADPFPDPRETGRARGVLARAFAEHPRDEWVRRLLAADIPAGPVNSFQEAFFNPQAEARQMLEHIDHPTEGRLPQIGFPVKFSHTPGRMDRPPPRLGQHTDEILTGLGYTPAEIARLRREGAA